MPKYRIVNEQFDPEIQKTRLTLSDGQGGLTTGTAEQLYLRKNLVFNLVQEDMRRFIRLLEAEVWVKGEGEDNSK